VVSDVFSQTCGTTNIALTKDAVASSHRDFSDAPNLVDASTSTNWKSDNTSSMQWVRIDLGQAYSICNIKIKWASDYFYASAFKVYVSNSTTAGSGTKVYEATSSASNENNITLSNPVSGQYVRVEMTQPVASWADHYEMLELEVYAGTGNVPPSTSITSPASNATFTYGSNIVINADATDADGTVSKVEFYEGTNKLGEDATAPYSFTWTNAPAGTYNITSKAIDNDNAVGTSTAVPISISSPPANSGWSLSGNTGVDSTVNFLGTQNAAALVIKTKDVERMRILSNGQVIVKGTVFPADDADFAVNGNIYAKKLKVTQTNWADYVFDSTYKLRPLKDVEEFIARNKHLPDVPSTAEVETNGLNVGDQHAVLLRKVEELTLYMIQQQKEIELLKSQLMKRNKKRSGK
jgi:hypothetical protein